MTATMHPLFAELFLDQPGDQLQDDDTRRARARRARRRSTRQAAKQTVRPRSAPRRG